MAPRLNFKKPLYLKASKVSLENMSLRVNFSNISSVLSIDYNDIGSSSLLGEMEDLKADELIAIQNIDFLIHGLLLPCIWDDCECCITIKCCDDCFNLITYGRNLNP